MGIARWSSGGFFFCVGGFYSSVGDTRKTQGRKITITIAITITSPIASLQSGPPQLVTRCFAHAATQGRVKAMCDIDPAKIGTSYANHRQADFGAPVPIIHFSQASGPVIVCVGLRRCSDEADGLLERNVASLGLTEGLDLWYFM